LHQVTFYLREFDADSKEELENGEAHAVYTTDGTRPDCMHGLVYEWGSPVTLYNTSKVMAGICAAGTFSNDLKKVNLVVVTPHLHSHYPIFWLSRDRHCARIDAPMAAFYDGPNSMEVTMADGHSVADHEYMTIEHHDADDVGPESVLACGKVVYPEEALYGWAASNRAAARDKAAAAAGAEGREPGEVRDGAAADSYRRKEKELVKVKMPDGSYMQVPAWQVEDARSAPYSAWSTWSAHPIPGVAVDRNLLEGLRPGIKRKDNEGNWRFAAGEYERENGEFNQWRIAYRSYDGSRLRIEAPPGTFRGVSAAGKGGSGSMLKLQKTRMHRVKVEWRNGAERTYVYNSAKEVAADDDGPAGIELLAPRGEFPPDVARGWAEQNIPPKDAFPSDRDAARHLEKAGVNVNYGFMTGQAGDRYTSQGLGFRFQGWRGKLATSESVSAL